MTKKTKAIMPVHLFGLCCDMDPVLELSRANGILVIEDAAQAIGADDKGRRAGSMGHAGCFSFFPSKNLGAFGDGGMVCTSSEAFCERLKRLRVHGAHPKYYHEFLGGNFRLDALQAAVVNVKLGHLEEWTSKRRANAQRYRALFAENGLDHLIKPPAEKRGGLHIYNQFVIAVKDGRDDLRQFLNEWGIGTEVYYPIPLHLQPCFEYLNAEKGTFPKAEQAAERTLALPIYPEIEPEQQEYVVRKIKAFYSS
jgi:dTDP-4-amino-4,6-dideoxygalactose transaminase